MGRHLRSHNRFFVLVLIGVLGHVSLASEGIPIFLETLSQAEDHTLNTSQTIKSSQQFSQAALNQADSSEDALYPRLTLEGNYFYQTHIPQIALGAGPAGVTSFGSNSNYNIGPTLYYTLFDGGQARKLWKSAKTLASARSEDFKATVKQLKLNLRLAYFKLQFSERSLILTSDSLKLSQAQEHEIRNRFRAGSASRLDAINAHRDVLNNQLKFRQVQNDLANSVRDLFSLTGDGQGLNASRPVPPDLEKALPEGVGMPTLIIRIDSIDSVLGALQTKSFQEPDQENPQIKSLALASDASKLAAESTGSGLWPKLQVSARSEYIYPDLILPQTAQQNIFAVNLTMPLFEFGLTRSTQSQHMKESLANEYQRQQKLIDLTRDWNKTHDLLESLNSQKELSEENAKEAAEAARLTFQSYRAGKQQYIDVETANLRLLEAQVNATQVQVNILGTITQLDYLSSQ